MAVDIASLHSIMFLKIVPFIGSASHLLACFFLSSPFDPENGNVRLLLAYTALHPRRQYFQNLFYIFYA
jgi:hypothetical protein